MAKIIRNGITYAGIPDIDYDCEISNVTLYAANWSNGVYTITDSRIDATSIQEYMPGLGITDTQLEALQSANIHDFGQDTGHAYLKAYGDIPNIDIPIRVMFNPGVKTKEVETDKVNIIDTVAITAAGIYTYTIPVSGIYMFVLHAQANQNDNQTLKISTSQITSSSDIAEEENNAEYIAKSGHLNNASTVLVAPCAANSTVWYSCVSVANPSGYVNRFQVIRLREL